MNAFENRFALLNFFAAGRIVMHRGWRAAIDLAEYEAPEII